MALSGSFKNYPVKEFGLYCEWSASQSTTGNYSDVTLKVYLSYYTLSVQARTDATASINGTKETYSTDAISDFTTGWKKKLLKTKTVRVAHDANGNANNIPLAATWRFDGTYSNVSIGTISASTSISLNKIDRTAPTVSISKSNITADSLTLSATANVNCDIWQYSLNNGSTWTSMSTSNAKSVSKTITGLESNTTYNIKVRARKATNQVYGTSPTMSATTLGNSLLNSVSELTVDQNNTLSINWTVYNASYTHKLEIFMQNNSVLTITGLTGSVGTYLKTISLTDAQRTQIYNYMSHMKFYRAIYRLTTYNGTKEIGSVVSKTSPIQISDASAPAFNDTTAILCLDEEPTTTALTGDNHIFVKGKSSLYLTGYGATAKNGASIVEYNVSVGSVSQTMTDISGFSYGPVSISGTVGVTIKAIDSRGYEASITKQITVCDYTDICLSSWDIRRVNEVEETGQLSFSGKLSELIVNGENINAFQKASMYYRKINENWSSEIPLNISLKNNNFSFDTDAITDTNGTKIVFDPNSMYQIKIAVQDKLTYDEEILTMTEGTPLIALRSKKVGINNPHPERALDISGGLKVDTLNGMLKGNNGIITPATSGVDYTTPADICSYCVTTSGTSTAYTVTIPGITALTAGISFIMIPHVTCTTKEITLNLNGLGAKKIWRNRSSDGLADGPSDRWLYKDSTYRVLYNSVCWVVEEYTQPDADDLYGTVSIEKGGTGANDVVTARKNLGIYVYNSYITTTASTAANSMIDTGTMDIKTIFKLSSVPSNFMVISATSRDARFSCSISHTKGTATCKVVMRNVSESPVGASNFWYSLIGMMI